MRVIIVDDEQNACENLRNKLLEFPEIVDIVMFSDSSQAFEYASKHVIDIAFLDIKMPNMSGLDIAYRLKEINIKTNIVFVTAYSQYTLEAFNVNASDYIMKPPSLEDIRKVMDNLRYPVRFSKSRIHAQCFGDFAVFVDGVAVSFQPKKAKELLAYLIDRRGVSVTPQKIASVLWEDKAYDRSLRSQVQTLIAQTMKLLKDNGIENIVIKKWNSLAVDTDKFSCDYYDFLNGNINTFTGEYMSDYSWAELTVGWLNRADIHS